MPIAFFDTECFPNYWLLKFKADRMYTFTLPLDTHRIHDLFNSHTVVGFNSLNYDLPLIEAALSGATHEQLKRLSDHIIMHNQKVWPKWQPRDHIDLFGVIPGQTSQKQYGARIHHRHIQSLPFDPQVELTPQQMQEVEKYCELDVEVLEALYYEMQSQLEQRRVMGLRYGLDLRSKSDAQMAEDIITRRCEQLTGQPIPKPQPPNLNTTFRYRPPGFIRFQHPQLQAAKRLIISTQFTYALQMPEELKNLTITLGNTTYALGIGGLHSQEQQLSMYASDTHLLRDADVVSYYPQLILNSGQYPPALGPAFQHIYRSLKEERLIAKAEQKKQNTKENKILNQGLKIQINGSFGKMGNQYSRLFAPEMLIYTTITGQLALLMLIEWHEAAGIPVISANTDGFVTHCPRERIKESDLLIKAWELQTGLEMEFTEYRSIHLRDVNSYIAITTNGEVKRKGKFGPAGLTQMKNPDTEICVDAVIAYLKDGTNLIDTISQCRDLTKFLKVQKVAGGAMKDNVPLGNVVRWYYGRHNPAPIIYQTNGNKVGRSEWAVPCQILPDTFPTDIHYEWYIHEAESLLTCLSKPPTLFD